MSDDGPAPGSTGQDDPAPSLRDRALKGGVYMVTREGVGITVRLIGLTLVVRLIGPASYGVYAAAAAFVAVATLTAQAGAEVYLIRQRTEPSEDLYAETFTHLLVVSVAVVVVALLLSIPAGLIVSSKSEINVFRVLMLSVPVNVLWAPAQAAIERRFDFGRIGFIEVVSDVVLYGVAVPLAYLGLGAWSLVAGFTACEAWLLVASFAIAGLRPRLRWSRATGSDLLRHGFTYAASDWVNSLGGLAVPVVVGGFTGATGVGLVALASRIVDTASFAKRTGWRVGLVTMSQVDEPERLRRGLEEGSLLEFLVLALPVAVVAGSSRLVIPHLFGEAWRSSVPVLALMGLSAVLSAPVIIQSTLLYSKARNVPVIVASVIQVGAMTVAAVFLVWRFGIIGFGIASLAAPLAVLYTDRVVRRHLARFGYGRLLPFAVAFAPIICIPLVPRLWAPVMLVPAVVVLAFRQPRADVVRVYRIMRGAFVRSYRPSS